MAAALSCRVYRNLRYCIDRTALKKRERALRQFGFKELETGIYIRPDNLAYSFEKPVMSLF